MIVNWLPRALNDRRRQISYVFQQNPQAAIRLEMLVRSPADILSAYSRAGRSGRKDGARELVVPGSPYLTIYRIDENAQEIQILRLLHGAQQWPPD